MPWNCGDQTRSEKVERVVIRKGPSVDVPDQHILVECLKIMFPECTIDIQSLAHRDDEEAKNAYQ